MRTLSILFLFGIAFGAPGCSGPTIEEKVVKEARQERAQKEFDAKADKALRKVREEQAKEIQDREEKWKAFERKALNPDSHDEGKRKQFDVTR